VERVDDDLMIIADNQKQGTTHERNASGKPTGKGKKTKTPTDYFLRAESSAGGKVIGEEGDEDVWPDEDTNDLPEPFMDDGTPIIGFAKDYDAD
jgi:hypothetical protein